MKKYAVHNLNKSRGFTLVELVVAIALLAMVGVLATSVVLLTTRSQNEFTISAKSQSEITRVEKLIKDWLMQYDTEEYTISVDPSEPSIKATINPGTSEGIFFTAEFENGVFTCEMPDDSEKTEELSEIEEIRFDIHGKIVFCTVTLKQNSDQYKILYTMRAAKLDQTPAGE